MSEEELLKKNIIYDLIVKNNVKEFYDWKSM